MQGTNQATGTFPVAARKTHITARKKAWTARSCQPFSRWGNRETQSMQAIQSARAV